MAIEKTLCAQKREGAGKGCAHQLRAQSLVPGVFYNGKGENIKVQVPALPLEKLYFEVGTSTVFNLEIDDNGTKTTYPCFFWDVQKHPYKKKFTHIDYYGVDLEKEVKVEVPLVFTGTAKGVKLGGMLETYREEVLISAKLLHCRRHREEQRRRRRRGRSRRRRRRSRGRTCGQVGTPSESISGRRSPGTPAFFVGSADGAGDTRQIHGARPCPALLQGRRLPA